MSALCARGGNLGLIFKFLDACEGVLDEDKAKRRLSEASAAALEHCDLGKLAQGSADEHHHSVQGSNRRILEHTESHGPPPESLPGYFA